MPRRFAELIAGAPRRVLAMAIVFAAVAGTFGLATPGLLGGGGNDFLPQGSESVRVDDAVERASGLSSAPQVLVLVRAATPARIARAAAAIRTEPAFPVIAPVVRSRNGRDALLVAYARADDVGGWGAAAARVQRRLPADAELGGAALATEQVNDRVEHDLTRAEAIAFPLLFLLALWVFRSVVAALLPLACGALTILGALFLLRLLNAVSPVSTFALNIVTGAALGLGIDYSLLLVSRFREELVRVGPGPEAVRATLETAGRTVAFSAVTVAAAIATLAVFPLGFLRSMGIAGALVAPLAGLISLTVLPALFVLLGPRVNALAPASWRRAAEETARGRRGGWYRLAHAIMRRPLPVALASAALLVALGIPFLSIRFTGVDATVLPAADELADRRGGGADRVPPRARPRAPTCSCRPRARLRMRARARRLPHATRVAPPQPVGGGLAVVRISSGRPFLDARSQRLVRELRRLGVPVGGSTAAFLDQKHAIGSRLPLAIGLLCAVTFVLLFAATRSLVLPLKALVMNLLTLSAAFGILVFVFQGGRLEGLLGYRSQGALELTQPVLLFAIAFGLSTDYGVFLLTRIKEAWDDGLPNREAVAVGLERTGRIVTAAALLFCIAVGSFATSHIVFVKEVGLGIALAVLIDATIVRALLVPALMALLGHWNWWPATTPDAAGPPPGRPRHDLRRARSPRRSLR